MCFSVNLHLLCTDMKVVCNLSEHKKAAKKEKNVTRSTLRPCISYLGDDERARGSLKNVKKLLCMKCVVHVEEILVFTSE